MEERGVLVPGRKEVFPQCRSEPCFATEVCGPADDDF